MSLNTQRITPAWAGKSIRVAPTPRIAGDHPRTGGEKSDVFRVRVAGEGSPPRRRGKAECQGMPALPHGITPARAGKSQTCPARRSRCRDHPRVGGEKAAKAVANSIKEGSPPRRRGKGVNVNCSADDIGITPAWAGKRSQVAAALQSGWDHPRIGGEKSGLHRKRPHQRGSPPHGRGKAAHPLLAECWHGDHPRVGGEKIKSGGPLDTARGSPPRGRGKVDGPPAQVGRGRITPAQAGKSPGSASGWPRRRDHPRTGGEKFSSLTLFGL